MVGIPQQSAPFVPFLNGTMKRERAGGNLEVGSSYLQITT